MANRSNNGNHWKSLTIEQRVFGRADTSDPTGCWEWTGGRNSDGYGHVMFRGRTMSVHRLAYTLAGHDLPSDLQLDHTCRNRACINPTHLRPVTTKQNNEHRSVRKGAGSGYRGVRKNAWGKWRASVGHNGRVIHLGTFETPEEAAEVARLKRLELFTHNDLDRV